MSRLSIDVMTSPGPQAGERRWRVVHDARHERSARRERARADRPAVQLRPIEIADVAQRDADVRMRHVPALDQRGGRPPHEVDRHRVAVAAARPGADQRGQADDLAVQVHERPARVAGVHLRVCLQIDLRGDPVAALQRSAATDDPGGDRLFEPQRAAHGQHPFADLRLVGVAEARRRQIVRRTRKRTTATSLCASRPTTSAAMRRPSSKTISISIDGAPSRTWLLVTT